MIMIQRIAWLLRLCTYAFVFAVRLPACSTLNRCWEHNFLLDICPFWIDSYFNGIFSPVFTICNSFFFANKSFRLSILVFLLGSFWNVLVANSSEVLVMYVIFCKQSCNKNVWQSHIKFKNGKEDFIEKCFKLSNAY